MQKSTKFCPILIAVLLYWSPVDATRLPAECRQSTGTIEIIDCLQNQKDIQAQLLEYLELTVKISEIQTHLKNVATPAPSTGNYAELESKSDPILERANWFDQELEVYAISGNPDTLTAYARLDGREYRLQRGDSIRLARVVDVYPRKIILNVLDHELVIGLAGRTNATEQ